MFHLKNLLVCLLLSASICQARTGGLRTGAQDKVTLQPWLVGLAAVVGFLFIVFFLLVVKRIFFRSDNWRQCLKSKRMKLDAEPTMFLLDRDEDEMEVEKIGFENKALDRETDEESKMTSL